MADYFDSNGRWIEPSLGSAGMVDIEVSPNDPDITNGFTFVMPADQAHALGRELITLALRAGYQPPDHR